MAVPFPEAALGPLAYGIMGFLIASVMFLGYFTYRLKEHLVTDNPEDDLRVDQIGLSHNAERILDAVLDGSELQSDLPGILEVSKATVSNSIKELDERNLILRKKKSNTYLIEPDREEIDKQQ